MPSKHKNPMLGWHPPAELSAWARAEAERRGVPLKAILDEALIEKRDRTEYPDASGGAVSEILREVLAGHYLAAISCDHERKLDNPVCACSLVHLGWHASVGAAVQAWIDHVVEVMKEL